MWILPCNHAKPESPETAVHGVLDAVHDPVWYKVNYAYYFKTLEWGQSYFKYTKQHLIFSERIVLVVFSINEAGSSRSWQLL